MTFPFPPSVILIMTAATILLSQGDCAPSCNLRAIFQTPRKNTDEFEILERSNFDSDNNQDGQLNKPNDPRSYANAQISLKFNESPKSCSCGENCQCKNQQPPIFYPIPIFIAPYFPNHQRQPQINNESPPGNRDNKCDGTMETKQDADATPSIVHDNHPTIEKDIKVSIERKITNEQIEDDIQRKQLQEIARTNEGDVLKNSKQLNEKLRLQVQEALVPYMAQTMTQPKQLVSFPIFGKNPENREEIWGKRVYQVGGYEIGPNQPQGRGYNLLGGSGYYANPLQGIANVYKQPTLLSLLIPSLDESRDGYYLDDGQNQQKNDDHAVDCQCNCCTKYEKELNE